MTISDLLTIIGIILAILAFISEKNREFVLLKFSNFHWGILIFTFLLCNYLIGYDWFRSNFDFSYFEFKGFPLPSAYAYIIAVSSLFWATWKIYKGPFPIVNKDKLILYYLRLLLKGEFIFLAELIEKYHFKDILDYLKSTKEGSSEEDDLFDNALINKKMRSRHALSAIVLHRIIYNDAFIDNVSNVNPYFFTDIISNLNCTELENQDFLNQYLKVLMVNKNSSFFREIKNNQNLSIYNSYSIDKERPILYSLFSDVNVVKINQAWRGVGEPAIIEILEESKREYSPLRESNREQDNDTLWSYRMYIAIWYFDIMVRQSIIAKIDDHMWMFYYWHFTEVILNNISNPEIYNPHDNIPSRNHEMLEDIISKQASWIDCAIKSENDIILKSICQCIGNCIFELATSNKLTDKTKIYLINWIWQDYITLFGQSPKQVEIINKLLEFGFDSFRNPILGIDYHSDKNEYFRVVKLVYDNRDKPKLLNSVANMRVDKFHKTVIEKINNHGG